MVRSRTGRTFDHPQPPQELLNLIEGLFEEGNALSHNLAQFIVALDGHLVHHTAALYGLIGRVVVLLQRTHTPAVQLQAATIFAKVGHVFEHAFQKINAFPTLAALLASPNHQAAIQIAEGLKTILEYTRDTTLRDDLLDVCAVHNLAGLSQTEIGSMPQNFELVASVIFELCQDRTDSVFAPPCIEFDLVAPALPIAAKVFVGSKIQRHDNSLMCSARSLAWLMNFDDAVEIAFQDDVLSHAIALLSQAHEDTSSWIMNIIGKFALHSPEQVQVIVASGVIGVLQTKLRSTASDSVVAAVEAIANILSSEPQLVQQALDKHPTVIPSLARLTRKSRGGVVKSAARGLANAYKKGTYEQMEAVLHSQCIQIFWRHIFAKNNLVSRDLVRALHTMLEVDAARNVDNKPVAKKLNELSKLSRLQNLLGHFGGQTDSSILSILRLCGQEVSGFESDFESDFDNSDDGNYCKDADNNDDGDDNDDDDDDDDDGDDNSMDTE